VTDVLNSYRCYDKYINTLQRVWILEGDDKNEGNLVAHNKEYVKVLVPKEQGLIG
jgi:hypothetical protein